MFSLFDMLKAAQDQKEWVPLKKNIKNTSRRYVYTEQKTNKTRQDVEKFIYDFFKKNVIKEHEIKKVYTSLRDNGNLLYNAKSCSMNYPFVKFRSICREFTGTNRNLLSLKDIFILFLKNGYDSDIGDIYKKLIDRDKVKNYLPFSKVRKRYYDWLSTEDGMTQKTKIEKGRCVI